MRIVDEHISFNQACEVILIERDFSRDPNDRYLHPGYLAQWRRWQGHPGYEMWKLLYDRDADGHPVYRISQINLLKSLINGHE